jgi:hypothetical protein
MVSGPPVTIVSVEGACITNVGLSIIAGRLKGIGDEPLHLGWGSGSGQATPNSVALFDEESESRDVMTSTIDTVEVTGDSYKLTGAMVANGDKAITNFGVFDADVGGNLLLHQSINPAENYVTGQVGTFLFRIQFVRGT